MTQPPAADRVARVLERARTTGTPVGPELAEECPDLETALAAQRAVAAQRVAAGDGVTGWKAALTSVGSQAWLSAGHPAYGRLFAASRLDGPELAGLGAIAPAVEPECLFRLDRDLRGAECDREHVLAATGEVLVALEVADCRVADWQVTLPLFVADNSAAGWYLCPDVRPLDPADLDGVTVQLELNGEPAGEGAAPNVLGHPADAVAWLVRALDREGLGLEAGQVVMSGSLSAPVRLSPGDQLSARFGSGQVLSVTW